MKKRFEIVKDKPEILFSHYIDLLRFNIYCLNLTIFRGWKSAFLMISLSAEGIGVNDQNRSQVNLLPYWVSKMSLKEQIKL